MRWQAGGLRLHRAGSGATGRCAIEQMLLSPFRSGPAHIMLFRMILPDRPIPGRAQEFHQCTDGAAEKGHESGRGHRGRSVGAEPRVTQLSFVWS
jgi:hypothetical protein